MIYISAAGPAFRLPTRSRRGLVRMPLSPARVGSGCAWRCCLSVVDQDLFVKQSVSLGLCCALPSQTRGERNTHARIRGGVNYGPVDRYVPFYPCVLRGMARAGCQRVGGTLC